MLLAMLWMERWLKFLSDTSAQYAPPQLTHTPAGEPEAEHLVEPADAAASTEEARLLQDALVEREQALAGLMLARGECLSQLTRVSGDAAAATVAAERAQAAADEAVAERDAARAERDVAVLAERQAWAGENERLKAAQRSANLRLAIERAATRAERNAWAGEDERLKQGQRQLRVQFALDRAAALAAQEAAHAASRADADAAAEARLAELQSALDDRQASLDLTQAALAAARNALSEAQSALAQAKEERADDRAEAERLRAEAAAKRAEADQRIAHLTQQLDSARLAVASAPAAAKTPPDPSFPPAGETAAADTAAKPAREKGRKGKLQAEPADAPAKSPKGRGKAPSAAPASAGNRTAAGSDLVVRFRKPDDWGETLFIYFWGTDPETEEPGWPGVPMQAEGHGWFVHRFAAVRAAHLVFADEAGHQTPNQHRTQSGSLDADGEWRTEEPEPAA
jgi:hypothetical protein